MNTKARGVHSIVTGRAKREKAAAETGTKAEEAQKIRDLTREFLDRGGKVQTIDEGVTALDPFNMGARRKGRASKTYPKKPDEET